MGSNTRQNNSGIHKVLHQMAAERGKLIPASCLIVLMIFMWGRVLFKKKPQAAGAATAGSQRIDSEPEPQFKISFVELPDVKGRNDVLSRDFFSVNDDRLGPIKEVSVDWAGEEDIKRVAEKLKLQAIGGGVNPQAFINDKLLSVGDKLLVSEGIECEVTGIED